MSLDPETIEASAAAGQLLIRAAAVIGALTPEQQAQLAQASALPALLHASLQSATRVSADVKRTLKDHPPIGFVVIN